MINLQDSIQLSNLWPNDGQLSGLPANPRFIIDDRFERLVKSLIDAPEMLYLRELLITPYSDGYIVIAGNMRLRAAHAIANMPDDEFDRHVQNKQELEDFNDWFKAISIIRNERKITCKVLPENTPIEKLREYAIKDNIAFGADDFELLANEWDQEELTNWGMILPSMNEDDPEEEEEKQSVARITIEFEDLTNYDTVRLEVEAIAESYKGVNIK